MDRRECGSDGADGGLQLCWRYAGTQNDRTDVVDGTKMLGLVSVVQWEAQSGLR